MCHALWPQKFGLTELRCFCIGCAKDRSLKNVIFSVSIWKQLHWDGSASAVPRTDLKMSIMFPVSVWFPFVWDGSASAAPRTDCKMYLPYSSLPPNMTEPKMCSQHSWDSKWTGIGCAEDGSHFRKLKQPKYKNKVKTKSVSAVPTPHADPPLHFNNRLQKIKTVKMIQPDDKFSDSGPFLCD